MRFFLHLIALSRVNFRKVFRVCGIAILLLVGASKVHALQNTASGSMNGIGLDVSSATVILQRSSGNALTSATAEISPPVVLAGSKATLFTYDILPVIQPVDAGLGIISITAPPGYAALTTTAVTVGAMPLIRNCPAPGSGEYCSAASGLTITIMLGARVTIDKTPIRVLFTADSPTVPGSGDFISTVGDVAPVLRCVAGNADGNPSNGNSLTVTTVLVNLKESLFTAAPLIVSADGNANSLLTAILRDGNHNPLAQLRLNFTSQRGVLDNITQPSAPTDSSGTASGSIRSLIPGSTTIYATLPDGTQLPTAPTVYFTQGQVLELSKYAARKEAAVGDIVTYQIQIRNKTTKIVSPVRIVDQIPANFKYIPGSTYLDGKKIADPAGSRTLVFNLGSIPALSDTNGNGRADSGEPGYLTFSYQLVVGSGAVPKEYVNTAAATDVCDQCYISNTDSARVKVVMDATFDLTTIIGKVYHDKNRNGQQDPDEPGIGKVMVALDNGTYALTDEYGRYHFPAISPGQRLVKVNMHTLPPGTVTTTNESKVVALTPGLLAKANFGVAFQSDTEQIGRSGENGIAVTGHTEIKPVEVVGNVETQNLLINGDPVRLQTGDARLVTSNPDEVIELKMERLAGPVEFRTELSGAETVREWRLLIYDPQDTVIRTMQGSGAPPVKVAWDGRRDSGELVSGGSVYQYQLELHHADGTRASGARRMIGVNASTVISLRLTGNAFKSGSAELTVKARGILKETAQVLKRFTREKILIEGHTDNVGSESYNMDLSKRRVEAALTLFVETEKLPRERFTANWYGKSRPIASNDYEEGRAMNRRVDIKGEFSDLKEVKIFDQYRTEPSASINGDKLEVDPQGRFAAAVANELDNMLKVEMSSAQGRSLQARLPLPGLKIVSPVGDARLALGASGKNYRVLRKSSPQTGVQSEVAVIQQLQGQTEPGNSVELDGAPVPVAADGTFSAELNLKAGANIFGLLVRNQAGYTRIANLQMRVSDHDDGGHLIVMTEPVPNLTVKLPPRGLRLTTPVLNLSGFTDPGNRVQVNGQMAVMQPDGQFTHDVKLIKGINKIQVKVTDPQGYAGTITRDVEYTDTHFFLLAFADGKVGQMQGKGYLAGAGLDKASSLYEEGRLAYYLKGTIAGKYLVTSSLDTGTHKFSNLFNNLDDNQTQKMLTNLDPDKIYPVYGDSSTIVNDTQSQGRFYLAVDSDELHILLGNYPMNMNDSELAAYQRTLYGVRAAYQSLSKTSYGQPDTKVELFGAEVRQAHIRDELGATGGSLYYLSHQELVEGSEQISLVVRDKNTGIILSSTPQQQNVDYSIKYDRGRVLFTRPISSVSADTLLINRALLAGNPVSIQVDYEARLNAFEKKAYGGHVRQQIGDHLAVGGTYIKDELLAGSYQLTEADTELRLGKSSRLVAEFAQSSGAASQVFTSSDGGLSFVESAAAGRSKGNAWKLAAESDMGEWFGKPGRSFVSAYMKRLETGFRSAGSTLEQGTSTYGLQGRYTLTDRDKLSVRFDWQDFDSTTAGTTSLKHQDLATLQYIHDQNFWQLSGELQSKGSRYTLGASERSLTAAARVKLVVTTTLSTTLEQQQTLRGVSNNQTTLGVDYQILQNLGLQASGTYGNHGTSAIGGASLTLGKSKIYLKEQLADDQAGHRTSTILGGEQSIGTASKVYSEFQRERSTIGDRSIYLLGAQKQWDLLKGLQLTIGGEHGRIDSTPVKSTRYALSAGLSYGSGTGLKVTSRNEMRYETGARKLLQYLTSTVLDLKLNPSFTLLAKYRYSVSEDQTLNRIEARFSEQSIGLAFRPVNNDRFNALARYTRLLDQRDNLGATSLETNNNLSSIISGEWSYELTSWLEWVDKTAFKIKTDSFIDRPSLTSRTLLSLHRLNYHVTKRVDMSAEYRLLRQMLAKDQMQGWLTELSWEPIEHMRLGVGYNFTDFSDDEFSSSNYSVHGWFFRLQGKY